jgi:hypothetical protein
MMFRKKMNGKYHPKDQQYQKKTKNKKILKIPIKITNFMNKVHYFSLNHSIFQLWDPFKYVIMRILGNKVLFLRKRNKL